MLDKWFLEDITTGLKNADRFVIIDEQKKCDFLFDILMQKKPASIFEVSSELDELIAKYELEKNYADKKAIIITSIPLDRLKFVREYCQTGGYLSITHLHRYIVQKVNEKMGFDLVCTPFEIIAIGKLSIGKQKDYWARIKASGKEGAFTSNDILEFLDNPESTFKTYIKEEQELFNHYISHQYSHHTHPLEKSPPKTIADEIATAMLTDLVSKSKDKPFLELYKKWIDSKKFEPALKRYVAQYSLPSDIDIWQIPVYHPFKDIDMQWVRQVAEHIDDKDWIKKKLPVIKERAGQTVTGVLNIDFWEHIYNLLSYDSTAIDSINDLTDAIRHYQEHFHKVDNAVRHLYTEFMSEKSLLQPIQEYYQQLVTLYLDKWFTYFPGQYQEGQTGLLKQIISGNEPPIAIIVGDALSYEVSQEIAGKIGSGYKISSGYKIQNKVICGAYPSETDTCMSSLFASSGEYYTSRDKRQEALLKDTNQDLEFMDIADLSSTHTPHKYTVLYSPDVDSLSEKQNQNALKYYSKFIDDIQDKIDRLFGCGYKKVFLVSDHGFVLTGLLKESDKVTVNIPDGEKFERYCVSKGQVSALPDHVIRIQKAYEDYHYLYFSCTLNPFKTRGPYGFAHGGISPQELLVPYLQIEKHSESVNLEISINNKKELESVVGDVYQIKLKAGAQAGDSLCSFRKVIIIFVKDKKEFNQSDIIQLRAEEEVVKEFSFGEYNEFQVVVVDAKSKARLDACKITRHIARDLGGLGSRR